MPGTNDSPSPTKLWPERLDDISHRGYSTREDCRLAGNWGTCAVGELYPQGINDYYVLRRGQRFYRHIVRAKASDSEHLVQFNIPLSSPLLRYHIWRAKRIYKRLTKYRSLGENNG